MSIQFKLPTFRRTFHSAIIAGVLLPAAAGAADYSSPHKSNDAIPQAPDPERFGSVRQKLHDWDVIVGAGASYRPKYEGSDEFEVSPIPFVSATVFDRLTIDPSGLDLKAYQRGLFKFDVNVGYDAGRSADDADALRGMGDIDFGVNVGGKATLSYGPLDFFASVHRTIGGSDGLLGTVGTKVTAPVNEHLILGAEASATFADKNYMESYFGVDTTQSRNSGYQKYKADAGIKSVDFTISATYLINRSWVLRGQEKLTVLVGDAADSPIVKEKVQPTTMLMLGYRF
jgi:outer membrane protein